MKKEKKETTYIKRIEVDEKTAEPIIVEVSEKEYMQSNSDLEVHIEKTDFVEMKTTKSVGRQMAMEKILGVKKEDESINKRQKIFKRITTVVFIVFVVGVLAYTAYNDFFANGKAFPSWEELKPILANSWQYLLLALFCLFLAFFFKGLKITIMCKSMTGHFHFKTSMETGIIGIYYNNVTPLAVGGQPFEIYHLSKHGVHGGVASSIPIATFFLNQLAFVILGIISLIMFNCNTLGMPSWITGAFSPLFNVLAIIGLVCCIFVPTLVIVFSMLPKIGAKLVHGVVWIGSKLRIIKNPKEMTTKTIKTVVHNSRCIKKLASSPLVFSSTFLLSFLENISNSSIAFFVLKMFGFPNGQDLGGMSTFSEWLMVVQICFILFAAITFIPTPGNSGAADLSFYLLFEAGLAAGLTFPAMMVWRFVNFYLIIIIGFLFATFKKKADLKAAALAKKLSPIEPIEPPEE